MSKRFVMVTMIGVLLLLAIVYRSATRPASVSPVSYLTLTPTPPLPGYDQGAAYVAAQATLGAGQSELAGLSQQATVDSLSGSQAANAAAQATLDYNQRQLMDLSIQATEIGRNMARAAATQQFIVEEAQIAKNATVTAQGQAATAMYALYILDVTRRAQAAQIDATRTAYSLTATPLAAIQADMIRTRGEAARRARWDEVVFTLLTACLILLIVLLFIAGVMIAYLRLMPLIELRLRTGSRIHESPMLLVDGVVDRHRQSSPRELSQVYLRPLPSGRPIIEVEIIGPSEPSISNWITKAEQKLRSDGWV